MNFVCRRVVIKMNEIVSTKEILSQIFYIRGQKVMLDLHLAALYGVETRALKQQVRRNSDRFPEDFMFELSKSEWTELITNCDNLGAYKFSPSLPFAFTEHGIAMLSSVLNSSHAVSINISIIRAFIKMRNLLNENNELKIRLDELETKYDRQFKIIFDAVRRLIGTGKKGSKPIGFIKNP